MRRKKIKFHKFPKSIYFVFIYFVVFIALSIFTAIQTSATGAEIARIEQREHEIMGENNELTEKMMNSTSLTLVSEKAEELGFVQTSNISYSQKDEFAVKLR